MALGCVGCGSSGDSKIDASIDAFVADVYSPDAPSLGSQVNPAPGCKALQIANKPSGVYYLQDPVTNAPFKAYCEQDRNGGGWILVFRSVLKVDGTTTAFWNINYASRFDVKGDPVPGANYYAGTVYREGRQYMDTITDLQGTTADAIMATATGFDSTTMAFASPVQLSGDVNIFSNQFASGWSSSDYDADPYGANCAAAYVNVTQHYGACWVYNLGADADLPYDDGGVGPHVANGDLATLTLATETNGGAYSRVNEIARYAR